MPSNKRATQGEILDKAGKTRKQSQLVKFNNQHRAKKEIHQEDDGSAIRISEWPTNESYPHKMQIEARHINISEF